MTLRAVTAFAASRDQYQLPIALNEAGLLESLVTDVYFPADKLWFRKTLRPVLGERVVSKRFRSELPSAKVCISGRSLLAQSQRIFHLGLLNPRIDCWLGEQARILAIRSNSALFMYSYSAAEAFRPDRERPDQRVYFTLQAHPKWLRQMYLDEIERFPRARVSMQRTYEFSLSEQQFEDFCNGASWATGWIAPSSFAARTLAENGIPQEQTIIVPYGVMQSVFSPRSNRPANMFTVVYVGNISYQKGIVYLLEAMRILRTRKLRIVLCTRSSKDVELLSSYGDLPIDIVIGKSGVDLAAIIRGADLFVFPSLADSFGHVVLEAMCCGVPVVASTNCCGPDLISNGSDGFIVPIRSAEAIAEKTEWGLSHRHELAEMGEAAAKQAMLYTWGRFRQNIVSAYRQLTEATAE